MSSMIRENETQQQLLLPSVIFVPAVDLFFKIEKGIEGCV